jgi:hypothetical protein
LKDNRLFHSVPYAIMIPTEWVAPAKGRGYRIRRPAARMSLKALYAPLRSGDSMEVALREKDHTLQKIGPR